MASKTLYQKQADTRTKTALKLRAKYDGRVRKYAAALVTALTGAADAKVRLDRINLLYGVARSTETRLVQELRTAGLAGTLTDRLGESTPGEELQVFSATGDGNGGAVLELEALFGEVAATGPGPVAGPAYDTPLNGPNQDAQGVTLAASAGDVLKFSALTAGGSAPASMRLSWGGAEIASVALLDRYVGKPFAFTHKEVTRSGVFAADVNLS